MDIALIISMLMCVGMVCQWLAWRTNLPAILFLLLAGILIGPVLNFANPDEVFSDMLMPMVSLSVAIVLFEGSLTLRFSELTGISVVVRRMVSIGALSTATVASISAALLFPFGWEVALVFGAVVVVTGPTVIVPMLRSVRPSKKIENILRWEGIAIDPVGALFAVLAFEFVLAWAGNASLNYVLLAFIKTIVVGSVIGYTGAKLLYFLLARNLLPEYLHNMTTLTLVLLVFAGANSLQHEAGLISVTLMGVWLANRADLDMHPILNFKEHLSVLLISMLFIVLAMRVDLEQLAAIAVPGLLMLLVIQFIARPIKVLLCTYGEPFTWQEKAMLSWIAPRGIVAAAISAIFADRLSKAGFAYAELIVPLTFMIIVGTVILQSSTSRFLAQKLGVTEGRQTGFLILGANALGRMFGSEFEKLGIRTVLADSNWENIKQSRMLGLETYYGNPTSEQADRRLDMTSIGGLLALSHSRYDNVLTVIHFISVLGEDRTFRVASSLEDDPTDKHTSKAHAQGNVLFDLDLSYNKLLTSISKGSKIVVTELTESFSWDDFCDQHAQTRYPMFIVSADEYIYPFVCEHSKMKRQPKLGDKIMSMLAPE